MGGKHAEQSRRWSARRCHTIAVAGTLRCDLDQFGFDQDQIAGPFFAEQAAIDLRDSDRRVGDHHMPSSDSIDDDKVAVAVFILDVSDGRQLG